MPSGSRVPIRSSGSRLAGHNPEGLRDRRVVLGRLGVGDRVGAAFHQSAPEAVSRHRRDTTRSPGTGGQRLVPGGRVGHRCRRRVWHRSRVGHRRRRRIGRGRDRVGTRSRYRSRSRHRTSRRLTPSFDFEPANALIRSEGPWCLSTLKSFARSSSQVF